MLDGSRSSATVGQLRKIVDRAMHEGPIGVLHILNLEGQATIVFRVVGSEHGLWSG
jgi:hypothetical protein